MERGKMTTFQCYCTLDELVEDAEGVSLDVSVLKRFILPASNHLSELIGPFLPVIETRKRTGKGTDVLFIPPLLRLTGSITNDGTTLTSSDYQLLGSLNSNQPLWDYGPYCALRVDPEAANLSAWSDEANGIEIPAAWGMYERAEATGATLGAQQLVGAVTLTVDDGSKLSPGMMVKIGDEWQFVTDYGSPTASVTTLGAALDASNETVTLANGALVKVGEIIKVDFEKETRLRFGLPPDASGEFHLTAPHLRRTD